jgi:NAD(P)-dependent dehydrogenase (short-subunit alcohol dehydrogenase family)
MPSTNRTIFFNALSNEDELHLIKRFREEGWECYAGATKEVALRAMSVLGRDKVFIYPSAHDQPLVANQGVVFDALVHLSPEISLRGGSSIAMQDWSKVVDRYLISYQEFVHAFKPLLHPKSSSIALVGPYLLPQDALTEEQFELLAQGLEAVVKMWARQIGEDGTRINAVFPGYMNFHLAAQPQPQFIKKIPMRRLGTFEDVFQLLSFLCGPQSTYLTGNAIRLNGGLTV